MHFRTAMDRPSRSQINQGNGAPRVFGVARYPEHPSGRKGEQNRRARKRLRPCMAFWYGYFDFDSGMAGISPLAANGHRAAMFFTAPPTSSREEPIEISSWQATHELDRVPSRGAEVPLGP